MIGSSYPPKSIETTKITSKIYITKYNRKIVMVLYNYILIFIINLLC